MVLKLKCALVVVGDILSELRDVVAYTLQYQFVPLFRVQASLEIAVEGYTVHLRRLYKLNKGMNFFTSFCFFFQMNLLRRVHSRRT